MKCCMSDIELKLSYRKQYHLYVPAQCFCFFFIQDFIFVFLKHFLLSYVFLQVNNSIARIFAVKCNRNLSEKKKTKIKVKEQPEFVLMSFQLLSYNVYIVNVPRKFKFKLFIF